MLLDVAAVQLLLHGASRQSLSWSSLAFWALPGYQLNSWWEIPSLPSMIHVIMDHFIAFRSTQTCSCFVLYLEFLATQHCSSLPWNITTFYVKNVVGISPPLKNSWYSDTSHPHHSFLVPVLFLTGILTIELWCVNSKLLETLLLWSEWSSFILILLFIKSPF